MTACVKHISRWNWSWARRLHTFEIANAITGYLVSCLRLKVVNLFKHRPNPLVDASVLNKAALLLLDRECSLLYVVQYTIYSQDNNI